MFKVRSVLFLMIAALVTGVVQCVGLHRAAQLWNARAVETPCPAPPAAEVPAEANGPTAEVESEAPRRRHDIGWLAVKPDAVEIDVDGQRLELPGYPAPYAKYHEARLTTAVFNPDRDEVAIAGDCRGAESEPPPSCARAFVRLYRTADGAHLRDLKVPWRIGDEYDRRVRAMAFDERGERLAVLLTATWADCMWEGEATDLLVYRVADGKRLLRRRLASEDPGKAHTLSFQDDDVHVATWHAGGPPKRLTVRLPKPKDHLASATTAS